MELLVKGARELGLCLTAGQVGQFAAYYRELVQWNQRMNLTAIVDPEEVQIKHFLDSLTATLVMPPPLARDGRIIDVGSGGGFPGLPIKLLWPGVSLALIESVGKKATFLRHLVEALSLRNVEVYNYRAEDLAHRRELRESFDVALSRGVAPMRILAELTLPFCRMGGLAVTFKKGDLEQEMAQATHALEVMGGRVKEMCPVEVEGLRDGRVVIAVEKVKPTPHKYPRRAGVPQKRPV